jgi:23S rRNA (cytidine2498-2'-O)-methyltransferase
VNPEHLLIVTAHPEFLDAAFLELKRLDTSLILIETLAPGIALCGIPEGKSFTRLVANQRPIFVCHLAPVQAIVSLTNTEADIGKLALAVVELPTFRQLERGIHFAVQARIVQHEGQAIKKPYSSGYLNQQLAEAISEETGAVESIKKPQVIVSLLCTTDTAYVGISSSQENLSDWPGGARHFAQTDDQISRAEFKLLEALEVFGLTLPAQGYALDLGAAPGGWTRLLLDAGMRVIAVDPANLDRRLVRRVGLEHYRGTAETFLEEAIRRRLRFDMIANDMRMDARQAVRLLVQAAPCLRPDGIVISALKLPHATEQINPLSNLKVALAILSKQYGIVRARQLFHNRQEVTVVAARPLPTRV